MSSQKVLLTGATGFIGSALLPYLQGAGLRTYGRKPVEGIDWVDLFNARIPYPDYSNNPTDFEIGAFNLDPNFVAFHHIIRLLMILFTVPVILRLIDKKRTSNS